ncbi:phosphoserine phosphatase [Enterovirga rhinocerotis]|uniref:Phosphoserine phosphatase n=2 Tax=Enterovirga rhinocerotis TaxID=1339210 RepID=A0A4R7C629_9HYPH|nr:phosphoserine phosphatase [Enterovirga rhinocerotis]
MSMRSIHARFAGMVLALLLCVCAAAQAQQPTDPLPSWTDGRAKSAILDFVRRVTQEGGPDFVPPPERIATFDNDGTLWAERPIYFQLAFALDEIKRLAPSRPDWADKEPYRSVVAGSIDGLVASGEKGLLDILAATHAGMTTEDFARAVSDWLASARHPEKNRPYAELVYQPQLELLAYLRANGFKTFIVSGGGIEFMRVFAESRYGIPPEQVVGSSGRVTLRTSPDGRPQLYKEAEVEFVDDGPGKPVGINRFIGRRPILAFGNSDGDLQMLQYTAAGTGPRLALILHHTDGEREWAYDRKSHIGKLDKALDEGRAKGWIIVDMKSDWTSVFPPER